MHNNNDKLIRLTGLWKNTSAEGKTYYSAKISPSLKVIIFVDEENKFKNSSVGAIYLCVDNKC